MAIRGPCRVHYTRKLGPRQPLHLSNFHVNSILASEKGVFIFVGFLRYYRKLITRFQFLEVPRTRNCRNKNPRLGLHFSNFFYLECVSISFMLLYMSKNNIDYLPIVHRKLCIISVIVKTFQWRSCASCKLMYTI